ncbi:MAG: hypothetical protein K2H23_03325 [Oscillospiraceae bacterium]|nr:hypothetical protein [Oscillospiraceae bacterium]
MFILFLDLDTDEELIGMFVTIAVMFAEMTLLEKGSFTVDDDKVVFKVGFIRYKYSYAKIASTETKASFAYYRLNKYFCVDFIINLNNGNTVAFRDWVYRAEAFSAVEDYNYIHDSHQFTKLSNYINERVIR